MFIAMASALGMRISGDQSLPPLSITSTEALPSSVSLSASTQPADPAPTMT